MAMDKRWGELFARMEAMEKELKELKEAILETQAEKEPAKKSARK